MKLPKTNAMRLLDSRKIPYTAHEYAASGGAANGLSVAQKTGRDPDMVYKTLVTLGASGGYYVFCIPVSGELNLKQAATAAAEKNIALVPVSQITALTGYVRGGVSPMGMKKAYPFFLAKSAQAQSAILVSGGKIGLQIELAPKDLLAATNGNWFTQ